MGSTTDDRTARAAAWLAAWDRQGIHRTATKGDEAGADWLVAEAVGLGAAPTTEEFVLDRLDPVEAYLECGARRIPVSDLFQNDGIDYLTRRPTEILASVHLPSPIGWQSTYWKLRRRGSFDFPVLSVAAAARLSRQGVVEEARIVVELGKRDFALAGTRDQADACAKSDQRGRGVRGGDRHALRASRRDPAGGAVFFQAEIDGFSPLVALIVVIAARIQADVSAERGHVADLRSGNQRGRLRQRGQSVSKARVRRDFRKRQAGPEP